MHHALEIQEILLNIFAHCRLPSAGNSIRSDLPALARSCHAFREPALDVLWGSLISPSPLARCLPGASRFRQVSTPAGAEYKCYSFCRSLTPTEWGILRSYTRRILTIADCEHGLDWQSVRIFLNPPPNDPLFPNLRHLYVGRSTGVEHLLYMPFPSMISLSVELMDARDLPMLQGSLESFAKCSPDIKRLSINLNQSHITFNSSFSSQICRWRSLETLDCAQITLGMDAVAHLSRIPTLTRLTAFVPSDMPPSSGTPLRFTNLHELVLYSESLPPISFFLSQTRLPATTTFSACITTRPSKLDFSSFLADMEISGIAHVIEELQMNQGLPHPVESLKPTLTFEDVRPYMALCRLRRIDLDLEWQVDLSERELLALASACPRLERFHINVQWGWNTVTGGITPSGLLQLLRANRSLSRVSLAFDTRDFTENPWSSTNLASTLPPELFLDVVDSPIQAGSKPAVAEFIISLVRGCSFSFRAWRGWFMEDESDYQTRWYSVWSYVQDIITHT